MFSTTTARAEFSFLSLLGLGVKSIIMNQKIIIPDNWKPYKKNAFNKWVNKINSYVSQHRKRA